MRYTLFIVTSDPLARFLLSRSDRLGRMNRLRPLTSNEVLDLAFDVYHTLGRKILSRTAVPMVFCLAALVYVFQIALPGFTLTQYAGDTMAQLGEAIVNLGLTFIIALPLFLCGINMTSGFVTHLVADYMLGNVPNVDEAWRSSLKSFKRMLKIGILQFFIAGGLILVSFLLLMISALLDVRYPGGEASGVIATLAVFGFWTGPILCIFVICRYALTYPLVLLEGCTSREAIRRSKALMKGGKGTESGYNALISMGMILFFLFLFLTMGFYSALGIISADDGIQRALQGTILATIIVPVLQLLPWFLATWVLVPVWSTITTILYYERRVRYEGFDIEALAQDVWRSDNTTRFEL